MNILVLSTSSVLARPSAVSHDALSCVALGTLGSQTLTAHHKDPLCVLPTLLLPSFLLLSFFLSLFFFLCLSYILYVLAQVC